MKKPVSGIAMGLIKNPGEDKYAVLSDILGDEDHLGDMDSRLRVQRRSYSYSDDIKCDGLSFEILEKALMQAKAGREHILNLLTETIAEPRAEMKPQVPRITNWRFLRSSLVPLSVLVVRLSSRCRGNRCYYHYRGD